MRPPRQPLYRQRRVVLGATALAVTLWMVSLISVLAWALQDDAQHADAIIVMGAAQYRGKPSPALRTRLDHAIILWQRGLAPRMVLTGGIGTGDSVSEASVGRDYVMAHGVPDSAILLDNEGRSSAQSLRVAADLMKAHRLNSAIAVSDPFHMLRIEILGRRLGLDLHTSPALPTAAARSFGRQSGMLIAESFKAPLAFVIDW